MEPLASPRRFPGSNCGGAWSTVHFSVAGDVNGWVIQCSKKVVSVYNCDGTPKVPKNHSSTFCEGWQVRGGTVYTGHQLPDAREHIDDLFKAVDEGENTYGTIDIDAYVAFIENYNLTSPPWSLPGQPNHDPEAPNLPTLSDSLGLGLLWMMILIDANAKWERHALHAEWRCCPDCRMPTQVKGIPPGPEKR